ncbi:hypothetical protein E4U54_005122 [Claviceps lovelessii]|nr:hypothetical protein E4U54_005122 [Claviceps lovelessii]
MEGRRQPSQLKGSLGLLRPPDQVRWGRKWGSSTGSWDDDDTSRRCNAVIGCVKLAVMVDVTMATSQLAGRSWQTAAGRPRSSCLAEESKPSFQGEIFVDDTIHLEFEASRAMRASWPPSIRHAGDPRNSPSSYFAQRVSREESLRLATEIMMDTFETNKHRHCPMLPVLAQRPKRARPTSMPIPLDELDANANAIVTANWLATRR